MLLPFVKIICVFIFMLLAMRKLGLGFAVLLGSFVMALAFSISPLDWFTYSLSIFSDSSILTVWTVVVFILSLSSLMESTGQAERFMTPLALKMTSPRLRMVFFPMLIGLLPMPGGAVFSAPMINAVAKELPIPEQSKSLINYWFRHTFEVSWPLYPAVILAAGFGGIATPILALWTAPICLVFFALGWFFFVAPHAMPDFSLQKKAPTPPHIWRTILWESAPLIMALGGALFFEALFALFLPQFPVDYGVIVALILAVILCLYQNNLGFSTFIKTIIKPNVRSMIFMVGALGVFKNVLSEGGIVQQLISNDSGMLTLWISVLILPLAVGILAGILMAAVGSIFPLIITLVETLHLGSPIPWIMLGLVAGMAGAMMTPLHICQVLSCEYFKVSLAESVRKVFLPALLYIAGGIAYFFVLSAILS